MKGIKKLGLVFGMIILSVVFLAACGGGGSDTAPAPTDQAPASNGETAGDAELIAIGEEQVQKSCIGCHGTDLQGGMGGQAPSLHGTQLSKDELIDILGQWSR